MKLKKILLPIFVGVAVLSAALIAVVAGIAIKENKSTGKQPEVITDVESTTTPGANSTINISVKAMEGLVYNGSPQQLLTTTNGGYLYYSLNGGTQVHGTVPSATEAGTYTVSWLVLKVTSDTNTYVGDTSGSVEVTIAKLDTDTLIADEKVSITKRNGLTYNGNAQSLISSVSNTSGFSLTIAYSVNDSNGNPVVSGTTSSSALKATNAGDYTIRWYIKADKNWTRSENKTISVRIAQARASTLILDKKIVVSSVSTTYTGSEIALVDEVNGSPLSIYYRVGSGGTYSTNMPTAKDVGDYTIYYYVDGNNNYKSAGSEDDPYSVTSKINPKTGSVSISYERDLKYNQDYQDAIYRFNKPDDMNVYFSLAYCAPGGEFVVDSGYLSDEDLPQVLDAGTYKLSWWIEEGNGYNQSNTTSETIVVAKAEEGYGISFTTKSGLVYNGESQELACVLDWEKAFPGPTYIKGVDILNLFLTSNETLAYRIWYEVNGPEGWRATWPQSSDYYYCYAVNAGTYELTLKREGGLNYEDCSITKTVIIEKGISTIYLTDYAGTEITSIAITSGSIEHVYVKGDGVGDYVLDYDSSLFSVSKDSSSFSITPISDVSGQIVVSTADENYGSNFVTLYVEVSSLGEAYISPDWAPSSSGVWCKSGTVGEMQNVVMTIYTENVGSCYISIENGSVGTVYLNGSTMLSSQSSKTIDGLFTSDSFTLTWSAGGNEGFRIRISGTGMAGVSGDPEDVCIECEAWKEEPTFIYRDSDGNMISNSIKLSAYSNSGSYTFSVTTNSQRDMYFEEEFNTELNVTSNCRITPEIDGDTITITINPVEIPETIEIPFFVRHDIVYDEGLDICTIDIIEPKFVVNEDLVLAEGTVSEDVNLGYFDMGGAIVLSLPSLTLYNCELYTSMWDDGTVSCSDSGDGKYNVTLHAGSVLPACEMIGLYYNVQKVYEVASALPAMTLAADKANVSITYGDTQSIIVTAYDSSGSAIEFTTNASVTISGYDSSLLRVTYNQLDRVYLTITCTGYSESPLSITVSVSYEGYADASCTLIVTTQRREMGIKAVGGPFVVSQGQDLEIEYILTNLAPWDTQEELTELGITEYFFTNSSMDWDYIVRYDIQGGSTINDIEDLKAGTYYIGAANWGSSWGDNYTYCQYQYVGRITIEPHNVAFKIIGNDLTYTGLEQELAEIELVDLAGSLTNKIYYQVVAEGGSFNENNYQEYTSTTTLTATNAGKYTIYYYTPAVDGYYAANHGSIVVEIKPAQNSFTIDTKEVYYNGEAQVLADITALSGTIYYKVGNTNAEVDAFEALDASNYLAEGTEYLESSKPSATAAGTYIIYYYIEGGNYTDICGWTEAEIKINGFENAGIDVTCADTIAGNGENGSDGKVTMTEVAVAVRSGMGKATLTYQWYYTDTASNSRPLSSISGTSIEGATNERYAITNTDCIGKYIYVVVVAEQTGYQTTTFISNTVGPVNSMKRDIVVTSNDGWDIEYESIPETWTGTITDSHANKLADYTLLSISEVSAARTSGETVAFNASNVVLSGNKINVNQLNTIAGAKLSITIVCAASKGYDQATRTITIGVGSLKELEFKLSQENITLTYGESAELTFVLVNQNDGGIEISDEDYDYSLVYIDSEIDSYINHNIDTESKTITLTAISVPDSVTSLSIILRSENNNGYSAINKSISITINQRDITIKANSADKDYDGSPLTDSGWSITEGTLAIVNGMQDVAAVVVTGSQTNSGESVNEITSVAITRGTEGEDVKHCYSITLEHGKLIINTNKNVLTINTPNGLVYNGNAQNLIVDVQHINPETTEVYYSTSKEITDENYNSDNEIKQGIIPSAIDAGKYTIYVYIPKTDNYMSISGAVEVVIDKAMFETPNTFLNDVGVGSWDTVNQIGTAIAYYEIYMLNAEDVQVGETVITAGSSYDFSAEMLKAASGYYIVGRAIPNPNNAADVNNVNPSEWLASAEITTEEITFEVDDSELEGIGGVSLNENETVLNPNLTVIKLPGWQNQLVADGNVYTNENNPFKYYVSNVNTPVVSVYAHSNINITGYIVEFSHWEASDEHAKTIYAKFDYVGKAVTVTFDAAGGTIAEGENWTVIENGAKATKEVTFDSTYGPLPTPNKTGYTFVNWFTADGTDDEWGTLINKDSEVTNSSKHTLYAQWAPITYSVRYYQNHDNTDTVYRDDERTWTYDVAQTLWPNFFAKTDSKFVGWATSTDGEIVYNDQQEVSNLTTTNEDVVKLYAVWASHTYKAIPYIMNVNGVYESSALLNISATYGQEINETTAAQEAAKLNVAVENGIVFSHAICGSTEIKGSTIITIGDNTEIKYYFNRLQHALSYSANGGTCDATSITLYYGQAYGELPTATRPGYELAGWFTQDGTSGWGEQVTHETLMSAADVTIYAKWEAVDYTVTFNTNGTDIDSDGVYEDTTVTPATKSVTYGQAYGALPTAFIAVDTSTNVYEANKYYSWDSTNGFVLQVGTSSPSDWGNATYYIYNNTTATITRVGYSFKGWFTKDGTNGWGIAINENSIVSETGNHSLHARWAANTYKVEFDGNGSTEDYISEVYVTFDSVYGSAVNSSGVLVGLPQVEKKGHTFSHWTIEGDTTGIQISKEGAEVVKIAGNHTLVAQWIARSDIEVTLDAGSGAINSTGLPEGWTIETTSTATKSMTYGSEYGELPTASMEGYTFNGWFTAATEGTKVLSTTEVANAENHTLYAQWTANTYTVTFDAAGGTIAEGEDWTVIENGAKATKEVTYDATYGTLPEPTREGYTFDGWYGNVFNLAKASELSNWTKHGSYEYIQLNLVEGKTYLLSANNIAAMEGASSACMIGRIASDTTFTRLYSLASSSKTYGQIFETFISQGDEVIYIYTPNWLNASKLATLFGDCVQEIQIEEKITSMSNVKIATHHTLVAKWTTNQYTVTFDAVGGTVSPTSKTVTYDDAYDELPTPEKTGYTFAGWVTENGTEINEESIVTIPNSHTLYAQWNANTYVLTANANGGTIDTTKPLTGWSLVNEATATKSVVYNTKYESLPAVFREGHDFNGWFTQDGTDDEWGEQVTDETLMTADNVTIYAKWTCIIYTLTANANGGTINADTLPSEWQYDVTTPAIASKEVTFGQAYGTLPEVVREGYIFVGWFDAEQDGNQVAESDIMSSANIEIYAQWQIKTVNVVIANLSGTADEGSVMNASVADEDNYKVTATYNYNETIKLTRIGVNGYTFVKWAQAEVWSSTETGDVNYTITDADCEAGTIYITAHYTYTFTVATVTNYVCNNDETADVGGYVKAVTTDNDNLYYSSINRPYQQGTDCEGTMSATAKDTYVFKGWYLDKECTEKYITSAQNTYNVWGAKQGEYAYYALFLKQSTLTIDAAEGTYNGDTEITNEFGKEITIQAPTRQNHTFSGWELTGGGTLTDNGDGTYSYTFGDLVGEDDGQYTLTAKWDTNQYTIKYEGNGHTGGSTADSTHTAGVESNLNANGYEKTGYTFAFWTLAQDGSGTTYGNQATIKFDAEQGETITLFAQWTANEYTIKYNGNGASSGTTADSIHTYDEAKKLTANGYEKVGYTFAGWNTNANGSGDSYTDEQEVINLATNGTVNLYAQWTTNSYILTANANGGTVVEANLPTDWALASETTATKSVQYNAGYGTLPAGKGEKAAVIRTGYSFEGWFTQDGTDESWGELVNDETLMIADNVTIYAKWTANSYTLTANANGGTIITAEDWAIAGDNKTATIQFTYPATYGSVNMPTVVREGYTEEGWYTKDGTSGDWGDKITDTTEIGAADVTIYVKWTPNTYTVVYDGNGYTSGVMESSSHIYDEYKALTANSYERDGYTFNGWNTNAEGLGDSFADGQEVVNLTADVDGEVTLYAQWTANKYTVTFDAAGGTIAEGEEWTVIENGAKATKEVTYDATYGTLPEPTREGYTFDGWYSENLFDYTVIKEDTHITHIENGIKISNTGAKSVGIKAEQFLAMTGLKVGDTATFSAIVGGTSSSTGNAGLVMFVSRNDKVNQHFRLKLWGAESGEFTITEELNSTNYYGLYFYGYTGAEITFTDIKIVRHITEDEYVREAGNHTITAKWTVDNYAVELDYDGGTENFLQEMNADIDYTYESYNLGEYDDARVQYTAGSMEIVSDAFNGEKALSYTIEEYTSNNRWYYQNKLPLPSENEDAYTYKFSAYVKLNQAGNIHILLEKANGWDDLLTINKSAQPNVWYYVEGEFEVNYGDGDMYFFFYGDKEVTYTIDDIMIVRTDGYTPQLEYPYTVESETVTFPYAAKTGYTFLGWYEKDEDGKVVGEPVTGFTPSDNFLINKTYHAIYEVSNPTIEVSEDTTIEYNVSSATLTSEITNNLPVEKYQWQVRTGEAEFENISGANSATYTHDKASRDAGTYDYRCLVMKDETVIATSNIVKVIVELAETTATLTLAEGYQYANVDSFNTFEASMNVTFNPERTDIPTMTYYYYSSTETASDAKIWDSMTATSLNVGTYNIYAVVDGGNNYKVVTTNTCEFTITLGDMNVVLYSLNDAETVYDESGAFVGFRKVYDGLELPLGMQADVARTLKYKISTENVWTTVEQVNDNIKMGSITEAGEVTYEYKLSADNYNDVTGTAKLIITTMAVDVHWEVDTNNYVFNGQDQSANIKAYITNEDEEREYCTITFTLKGSTTAAEFINVGTYTANASLTIGNYTLNGATYEFDLVISPLAVTIKANDATMIYGDNAPIFEYTATPTPFIDINAEDVEYTIKDSEGNDVTTSISTQPVGTYTIVPSIAKLSSDANYTVTYVADENAGKLTINPYNLADHEDVVTIAAIDDQQYIGSAITPEPVVTVVLGHKAPDTTELTTEDIGYSYTDNINVGTATITITGKGNYSGELTTTFEIVAKPIEKPTIQGTYVYDGTEQTVSITGFDENFNSTIMEIVTANSTLSATNADEYTVEIKLKNNENYTFYTWADGTTDNITLTWEIEKADVVLGMNLEQVTMFLGQTSNKQVTLIYNDTTICTTATGTVNVNITAGGEYIEATSPNDISEGTSEITITPRKSVNELQTIELTLTYAGDNNHKASELRTDFNIIIPTIKVNIKDAENKDVTDKFNITGVVEGTSNEVSIDAEISLETKEYTDGKGLLSYTNPITDEVEYNNTSISEYSIEDIQISKDLMDENNNININVVFDNIIDFTIDIKDEDKVLESDDSINIDTLVNSENVAYSYTKEDGTLKAFESSTINLNVTAKKIGDQYYAIKSMGVTGGEQKGPSVNPTLTLTTADYVTQGNRTITIETAKVFESSERAITDKSGASVATMAITDIEENSTALANNTVWIDTNDDGNDKAFVIENTTVNFVITNSADYGFVGIKIYDPEQDLVVTKTKDQFEDMNDWEFGATKQVWKKQAFTKELSEAQAVVLYKWYNPDSGKECPIDVQITTADAVAELKHFDTGYTYILSNGLFSNGTQPMYEGNWQVNIAQGSGNIEVTVTSSTEGTIVITKVDGIITRTVTNGTTTTIVTKDSNGNITKTINGTQASINDSDRNPDVFEIDSNVTNVKISVTAK